MDGLMVDTEPLARLAWERTVALYGASIDDDLYHQTIGRRTIETTQLVLDALRLPVAHADLMRRKTDEYLNILAGGVPVMPGLWTLLDRIEAAGLPWAVATSTPRPVAEIVLGMLGVTERYHALACGDEVTNGKPAPDIFLLAALRLDALPAACLALEDSPAGCTAAAAAGMRVAAVPTDMTRSEAFPCAYRCYPSLAEVAADLEQLLVAD